MNLIFLSGFVYYCILFYCHIILLFIIVWVGKLSSQKIWWSCQVILKEVDETFTDAELNGIISDVSELITTLVRVKAIKQLSILNLTSSIKLMQLLQKLSKKHSIHAILAPHVGVFPATLPDILDDMGLDWLLSVWRESQMKSLSSFLPRYPSLQTSSSPPKQPCPPICHHTTHKYSRTITSHEKPILGQFHFRRHILLITFSTLDWPWRLRNDWLWRICQDHDLTVFWRIKID